VKQQILPSLALQISVNLADETEFLSSLLDEQQWMRDYFRDFQQDSSSPIPLLRRNLLASLHDSVSEVFDQPETLAIDP